MDPNYNFGYGDTYGSGAVDPANDPNAQYGWASQWTQPASAAAQAPSYPQYVSQHQQQQQQQAQQQAQNAYAAMNPISSFIQQQQKPYQQQQQQQKKFGQQPQHGGGAFPKPQSAARSFGAFGGGGAGGMGGASVPMSNPTDWGQPIQQHMMSVGNTNNNAPIAPGLRSFPSKNGGGAFPAKPNWRQNKPAKQAGPKKFDTAGKTPAMILHEVFKQVKEEYAEVEGAVPKRYRCTLTVDGRPFQMESANKKAAKQKCAELVVRELRPDLHVTPFEEGVTAKAVPVKNASATGDGSPSGVGNKRNATEMMNQPAQPKKAQASAKKAKLSPVESALSLLDLMQKLIAESKDQKYVPVFEAQELPPTNAAVPSEASIKQEEPMEAAEIKQELPEVVPQKPSGKSSGKSGKYPRKPEVQHKVTLKFVEQGKEYTKIGPNRGNLKDTVIREALRDLFQIPQEDINTVARRHASNRLGNDMNIIQCLHTICAVLNCTLTVECEPAEDRPIGEGRMYFMGRCSIVDHNEEDRTFETKSPSLNSKTLAKEFAAQEMLKNYFQIDPATCVKTNDGPNSSQGPCAILHAMLNKQNKDRVKIAYEFKDNVPPVAGNPATVFYCDCVINDTDRYTGSGRSKKLAKNAAAMIALKKMFNIDFDPNACYPLALSNRAMTESNVSVMAKTIAEFCKREYHSMTEFFHIQPSNLLASFILVNERDEKRLLTMGSSIKYVVEPDTLNGANGTSVLFFDPIVLARRALLRLLISELNTAMRASEEEEQTDEKRSILEKRDDGKYALRSNFRLVLYSTFSPNCSYSVDDAPLKTLSIFNQSGNHPVPSDVLTLDEIRSRKELRIQSTSDKIYKWNQLGVQGALLSNILHPVYITDIYFGTTSPASDESIKYALMNRMESSSPSSERDIIVESLPFDIRPHPALPQVWSRGYDTLETLDLNTGRTMKGSPSFVCKAQIFDAYRSLQGVDREIVDYSKAKENASEYQYEKKVFYGKLEAAGFGKWQTKPVELVDSFTIAAMD